MSSVLMHVGMDKIIDTLVQYHDQSGKLSSRLLLIRPSVFSSSRRFEHYTLASTHWGTMKLYWINIYACSAYFLRRECFMRINLLFPIVR